MAIGIATLFLSFHDMPLVTKSNTKQIIFMCNKGCVIIPKCPSRLHAVHKLWLESHKGKLCCVREYGTIISILYKVVCLFTLEVYFLAWQHVWHADDYCLVQRKQNSNFTTLYVLQETSAALPLPEGATQHWAIGDSEDLQSPSIQELLQKEYDGELRSFELKIECLTSVFRKQT